MSSAPWKVLSRQTLLKGRYLEVELHRVETESGVIIEDYHLVKSPSWAATLAVTSDARLILIEQYRHGHGGTSLELPAGVIEEGEDIVAAGARELLEETGYRGQDIAPFWKIRPEPARHDQWAHFLFAKNCMRISEQALDATENVRVVLRPVSELDAIVSQMVHAVHVGALLLAAQRGLI